MAENKKMQFGDTTNTTIDVKVHGTIQFAGAATEDQDAVTLVYDTTNKCLNFNFT